MKMRFHLFILAALLFPGLARAASYGIIITQEDDAIYQAIEEFLDHCAISGHTCQIYRPQDEINSPVDLIILFGHGEPEIRYDLGAIPPTEDEEVPQDIYQRDDGNYGVGDIADIDEFIKKCQESYGMVPFCLFACHAGRSELCTVGSSSRWDPTVIKFSIEESGEVDPDRDDMDAFIAAVENLNPERGDFDGDGIVTQWEWQILMRGDGFNPGTADHSGEFDDSVWHQ